MSEKIDPMHECERLAKHYAAMNDLELKTIGSKPESLTEWARGILKAELQNRGMEWPGDSGIAHTNASQDSAGKPIILRVYRDMPAAYVDRSVLEAAGIRCFLQDANVVRMDWLWSNAMGGIKLVVSEADAEDAAKILDSKPPAQEDQSEG